jgi:Protein of unknown function (DUF2939)/GYF domain 2
MRTAPNAAVPPHPFDAEWHAHVDGKTYGPYSGHEIRRMVEQRQIVESDFVCPAGGSAWVQAKSDPTLSALFQSRGTTKPGSWPVIGRPRSRIKAALVVLVLISLGWLAWPYYALYELTVALREGDTAGLEDRIAWDSLRQGLRGDLNALFLQKLSADVKPSNADAGTGLAAILAPAIINQLVDGYVTPQAVGNLIRTGKLTAIAKDAKPAGKHASGSEQPHQLSLRQVTYAFFSGGPMTFKVEVVPENGSPVKSPLTLILKWSGDWRLTRIILPADALDAAQPTRRVGTSPSTAEPKNEKMPTLSKPAEPPALEVTLVKKGFKKANPQASDFEDDITFELSIKNLTDKDIRAFDGTLTFTDLLDNTIMSSSLAINETVRSKSTVTWNGVIKYNQFLDRHQRLRNESQENIKASFVPRKLLFADGNSSTAEPENAKIATAAKPTEPAPLEVTLVKKGFKSANPQASDFEDDITFELSIKNLTGKNIRAFDGTLTFTDLLDNTIMSSSLAINEPVRSGAILTWKGVIKYNQFIDAHKRLRSEGQANLKINFAPRKLLFADGSSKEYDKP